MPTICAFVQQIHGGVDLADAMRRDYSTSRKSKYKWYMRLFWFLLDTCIVNAYILECESPNHKPPLGRKHRPQLDFVVELGQQLVEEHSSRKTLGRPTFIPPSESRYTPHVPVEYNNPRNCTFCTTKTTRKRTKYGCACCGVALCIVPCFGQYHSQSA